jgi:nitrate reductase NapE
MRTHDASPRNPIISQPQEAQVPPSTKVEELRSFLFLTIVMAPALTFLLIAGYGFVVWMVQLVSGPPSDP